MMNQRICTSITSTDFADCMHLVHTNTMVELRLDLMQLTVAQVQQLLAVGVLSVVTCREGVYPQAERLDRLKQAIAAGAHYVDIEIESEPDYAHMLAIFAKERGCKVIISYHNFETTPLLPALKQIVAQSQAMGADVVKLITTAHSVADNARLLSLYETEPHLVAFAMGAQGKLTRFACLYLGAPFTYASSAEGKEAAPGQLSVQTMRRIIEAIG